MPEHQRPTIGQYQDPVAFLRDMIHFRKQAEQDFSVLGATRSLRRVSPALVSLILKKKRKITPDRIDELSYLMNLNSVEKTCFRNWINGIPNGVPSEKIKPFSISHRKEASLSILNDWLHVYVKDFFQIPSVQKNPERLFEQLQQIASQKRIQKSIRFLLHEGYLRRTLEGPVILDTRLSVADPHVPSRKIRQFHKAALSIAKQAIDLFPAQERMANTLTLSLNEKSHAELLLLIREFTDKLQDFAAAQDEPGNRLYQLIVNLSPIGRKVE